MLLYPVYVRDAHVQASFHLYKILDLKKNFVIEFSNGHMSVMTSEWMRIEKIYVILDGCKHPDYQFGPVGGKGAWKYLVVTIATVQGQYIYVECMWKFK